MWFHLICIYLEINLKVCYISKQVYPPYFPTDESSIEASFVHFDKKFSENYLSENDAQTLCFIRAVASCFKQFPYVRTIS